MTDTWLATCPDATKAVLVRELAALGATELVPSYRAVAFRADLPTAYRAHLLLRTASRLQRLVATLPASDLPALSGAAGALPWREWLRPDRRFRVQVLCTDPAARALGEDAVAAATADAARAPFERPPRLDDEALVAIVAHLRGGVCTLGLDTSGLALHKRGWRVPGHPAVLKETLAAAILLLAGYDGTEPLLDPMCGSGTFLVEAATLALRKAPLVHRRLDDFGLPHLAGFERATWRAVWDEVRDRRLPEPPQPILGSDARAEFVEVARRGALRARVEKHLTLSVRRFEDLVPPAPTGLLVANLPYGERIGRGPSLYATVGRTLRERFGRWRWALLVPRATPTGALGLRPDRVVPLENGAVPVSLWLSGDRRAGGRYPSSPSSGDDPWTP